MSGEMVKSKPNLVSFLKFLLEVPFKDAETTLLMSNDYRSASTTAQNYRHGIYDTQNFRITALLRLFRTMLRSDLELAD